MSTNESMVWSKATFSPTPEDDGHILKCQATNPSLPATPLEDTITLNVVCKLFLLEDIFIHCDCLSTPTYIISNGENILRNGPPAPPISATEFTPSLKFILLAGCYMHACISSPWRCKKNETIIWASYSYPPSKYC